MRNPRPIKAVPSKTGYVKFSNKLSSSLDQISSSVRENAQMIDTIQEVALELTTTFGSLHGVAVKYARSANQVLDVIVPIVKNLPIVPKNAQTMLINLEKWTQMIIDNEAKTSATVNSVRSGLQSGDVNKLKTHAADLKAVTSSLAKIVPGK
ncbi:MAG: hypothetical protein KF701_06100 [Anaerolineales bacterium]|nr:MAG: hypothetical protein KF701_06100 [Anaerolineales bacterium]